MKRLCLALAVVFLLLLSVGVGTAAAEEPTVLPDATTVAEPDAGSAEGTAQQPTTDDSYAAPDARPAEDAGSLDQSNDASSDGTAGNLNATKQDADQEQDSSGIQAIGQSNESDQDAAAFAFTLQEGASNLHKPVRVFSTGDSGDVTQSNDASSDATAANLNATKQDADQDQSSGDCKCADGGLQVIGQKADSEQDATALAATKQEKPSNTNISVRVLSPGNDGDVTQSNTATSDATAANINLTKQDADQEQGGDCKCGYGEQVIAQKADSDQKAAALAATKQEKPSNTNISVRVLSEGDDGDVTQSNTATSDATAANINLTKQDADQKQDGSGVQAIGQKADSDQTAKAAALTVQEKPSNKNISVRVLSPGNGGDVTQSNTASSNATAFNLNATKQDADQSQYGDSCKCGSGEQVIGQKADSDQKAVALAATVQEKPSNTNTSIRVLSEGDDGDVSQTNDATSNATAVNLNALKQDADQEQDGSGFQFIGQDADSEQDATAAAFTFQHGASNTNTPVRVLSPGGSGSVTQANTASSDATAANINLTKQDADQYQGDDCKCGSGEQVIAQFADNDQKAAALSATFQVKPSNTNTPVRDLSWGDDGDVSQTNEATSNATAVNLNALKQDADQDQSGSGIQVIGQAAKSEQDAFALGLTFQVGASNTNTPVRVLSPGGSGSVTQANTASSDATAANINLTKQDADQYQGGSYDTEHECCGTIGIQAIGQLAKNDQKAKAAAVTFQVFTQPCKCGQKDSTGNTNAPVSILSHGHSGSVDQSNTASSDADAFNINLTKQDADQDQTGSCRCKDSYGIQAIGQLNKNDQYAAALAATFQIGASNTNAPVEVGHGKSREHEAREQVMPTVE